MGKGEYIREAGKEQRSKKGGQGRESVADLTEIGSAIAIFHNQRENLLLVIEPEARLFHLGPSMESTSQAQEIGTAIGAMLGCVFFLLVPVSFVFFLVMACVRKTRGWVIATVVCGIVLILGIGGVLVTGVLTGYQSAKSAGFEASRFPTRDGLAEIIGAPGWQEIELGSEDASLMLGSTTAEEYLMVLSEATTDFPEGYTLAEFAELASQAIIDAATNPTATELAPVQIGDLPAFSHEVTGTVSEIEVIYHNTFIQGESHFHQIISWTLPNHKAQGLTHLRVASSSFREMSPEDRPEAEPDLIPQ